VIQPTIWVSGGECEQFQGEDVFEIKGGWVRPIRRVMRLAEEGAVNTAFAVEGVGHPPLDGVPVRVARSCLLEVLQSSFRL
jgi:hypothetical protein